MLEALEALGLAANIFQIISFAGDAISTFKAILRGQSPDTVMTVTVAQFLDAFEALSQSLKQNSKPLTRDEQEILDIATQCLAATADLRTELGKRGNRRTAGSYKAAFTGVLRKVLHPNKMEELEKVLRVHRETLENRLLQRVCKQSDAIMLQQSIDFVNFDTKLCDFINAIAAGETRLARLIVGESESTKEHVTLKIGQLRDDMYCRLASESGKGHLALSELAVSMSSELSQTRHELFTGMKETAEAQDRAAEHRQLLDSLRYSTLNARRNQIVAPDEHSFHWIFGSMGDDAYSDAESDEYSDAESDESEHFWSPQDQAEDETENEASLTDCSVEVESSGSFLRWLRSEGPVLYWITGKAGSGKSTLMKFLVNAQQTRAELREHTVLSHFVWSAGQQMGRSIQGITCSLLYQLLQDDLLLSAFILNKVPLIRHKKSYHDWSVGDLERALLATIAASHKPICVFIDGLDEIDSIEEQEKALDLVGELCGFPKLKICISSRPEPPFQRRLSSFPGLHLHDLTRRDIKRYTSRILRQHFSPTDPEFHEFVQRVSAKSEGVFLWVSLAVKSLQRGKRDGDTLAELRQRLEMLPNDLAQLYESMWDRLKDDKKLYSKTAAKLLNYVLHAEDDVCRGYSTGPQGQGTSVLVLMLAQDTAFRHRLILEEDYRPSQQECISRIEETIQHLVRRCAGLLDVDRKTLMVQLIHRSAKEFLDNTPSGQQIMQSDTATAESRISDMISSEIALVRLQEVFEDVSWRSCYPTASAGFIVKRLHDLSRQGRISLTKALEVMTHVEAVFRTGFWHSSNSIGSRPPVDLDFLGIAVSKGFMDFVRPALDKLEESALDSLSTAYKGYLVTTACVYGHVDMVEFLIRRWSQIGNGGLCFPTNTFDGFMAPCTPIMALCKLALSATSHNIFPIGLETMLRLGTAGSLEDVTTFLLQRQPSEQESVARPGRDSPEYMGFSCSDVYLLDTYAYLDPQDIVLMRSSILVEANVAYILDLYQKMLQRRKISTEGTRRLSAEAARHFVPRTARVRYFQLGVDDYGAISELLTTPCSPASKEDSSYLLEGLMNFELSSGSEPYLTIPGFGQRVLEVARRGKPCDDEIARDLERSKFAVNQRDVKDWPPKP